MKKVYLIASGIVVFVVLLVLSCCFSTVPTGYTGILTTFGKVENVNLDSGFHFKTPFQKIVLMDNRTQKKQITVSAFSSDIQQVDVLFSVNYNIDKNTAKTLYQNVGVGYFSTLVLPRSVENIKNLVAKYTADQLINNREILAIKSQELISKEMQTHGINIVSINIENIDFSDAYTNAVEAKQVAAQKKLQAETAEAQKTMESEAEAKRKIIAAEAEAQIVQIQADSAKYAGEKEAEMNRKLSETLTKELVQYYTVQRWDGLLPKITLGGNSIPMIDISNLE